MADFLWRALLGGVGVALIAGPLGCFIVWRRMAYFGDSLAHSALMGIALGFLLGVDLTIGIIATCIAVALFLVGLQRQKRLTPDTLLVILSHSALSIGLIAISFTPGLRVDLTGYLFGDILAVSRTDLVWIYGGGALILAALAVIWRPLLGITVHEDLARAEGVAVEWIQLAFVLLIAVTIALAMKVIGVLLVSALLIIPAATARRFARTPEQMAIGASAIGTVAVLAGLAGSLRLGGRVVRPKSRGRFRAPAPDLDDNPKLQARAASMAIVADSLGSAASTRLRPASLAR
jgi:zinc transport system permease protein